jgi:hypothetical protein
MEMKNVLKIWAFCQILMIPVLAWNSVTITENAFFKPSENDKEIAVSKFSPTIYIKFVDERAGLQPIKFSFENNGKANMMTSLGNVMVIKDRRAVETVTLNNIKRTFLKDAKNEAALVSSLCIIGCTPTQQDYQLYSAAYVDQKKRQCLNDCEIKEQENMNEFIQKKIDEISPYAYKNTVVIPDTIYDGEVYFPKDLKPPFKLIFTYNGKKRELVYSE